MSFRLKAFTRTKNNNVLQRSKEREREREKREIERACVCGRVATVFWLLGTMFLKGATNDASKRIDFDFWIPISPLGWIKRKEDCEGGTRGRHHV